MCSDGSNAALPALGFPIRESTDQRLFSASPWLIAAVHALHRLRMPRHPPCALTILTVIIAISHVDPRSHEAIDDQCVVGARRRLIAKWRRAEITVQFSKIAEEAVARVSHDGLSKLNSMLGGRRSSRAPGLVWVAAQVRSTYPGEPGVSRPIIPRKTKSRERRQERFRSGPPTR